MKISPTPVIPVLIVGACLMGVFFLEFEPPPPAKPKGPVRYTVSTRFAIPHPALAPGAEHGWLQSQLEVLSSRELLLHVVYRLNLDQHWNMSANAAIDRLKRHLTFELKPGSNIVTITAWGDKLNDYLYIADAVRDNYEEYRNNEALEVAAHLKRKPPVETSIEVLQIAKEVKPKHH